jgi:hypothetical protein
MPLFFSEVMSYFNAATSVFGYYIVTQCVLIALRLVLVICFKTLSLFDTMLNFVENLLENERDLDQDQ